MKNNLIKIILLIIIFFNTNVLFALNFPSIIFESETVRKYGFVILPLKNYYFLGNDIKSISVSSYENDLEKNKINNDFPSEYTFDERGRLSLISSISDSVAENRSEYSYNENGFLNEILEQQYTYNQLYKEKRIIVLRLQDNDKAVRIIQKELHADEKISTETISIIGNKLVYVSDANGDNRVETQEFNERGLLEKIEIKKSYPDLPHLPIFYTEILITYDALDKIIEYRVLKEEEIKYYYTFEYDSDSMLAKIVETDFKQAGQYKRIYNFLSYDEQGNWLEMREDIYSWGTKVSEYYVNRELEYWR